VILLSVYISVKIEKRIYVIPESKLKIIGLLTAKNSSKTHLLIIYTDFQHIPNNIRSAVDARFLQNKNKRKSLFYSRIVLILPRIYHNNV